MRRLPPKKKGPKTHDYAAAAVIAAGVVELLTQQEVRLHWVVDLRGVGRIADPTDPTCTVYPEWGNMITRLRGALDDQPDLPGIRCHLVLTISHLTYATGHPVRSTFSTGYKCDVARFMKAGPPVGHWLLWPVPFCADGINDLNDRSPHSWWYDDIPF